MDLLEQISRAAFHPEVPTGGDSASQGTCGVTADILGCHVWTGETSWHPVGTLLASTAKNFRPQMSAVLRLREPTIASGVTWHIVSALEGWLHERYYWF